MPDDLRAIMRRLPQGVCDGLTSIVLCLGAQEPTSERAIPTDYEPDPYTGRIGMQIMPDVWVREFLGTYYFETACIRMIAYIYPPDLKDRDLREFLLKFRALSTFVHEIAHHHDITRRAARGRWLPEPGRKCEDYADEITHEWLHQIVVPYLEEIFPDEARRWIEWVEHHGGVRLSLDQMAGDPRSLFGDLHEVLFYLVEWVDEDRELNYARIEFADFLHMCEFYLEAMDIVERILAQDQRDFNALRLKADILSHQEHYAEAREIALKIIAMNPESPNAWRELWNACQGLKMWEDVIAATTREFELLGSDLKSDYTVITLSPRIKARIALGDFANAEADIQLIEQSPYKLAQKRAVECRIKLKQAMGDKPE